MKLDEPEVARVRIQWPDSDACLHLTCVCGKETHSDVPHVERLTCKACGREWRLDDEVAAFCDDSPVKETP